MPNKDYKKLVLDARPDRLDLRDREYRPHLKSLPFKLPHNDNFIEAYAASSLILDQGQEGACTGFGLAATINFLIWRDLSENISTQEELLNIGSEVKPKRVSERMLYHMAQVYDEWDGEDYSGSSCRGAMKGWHRHGVCRKILWDYDKSGKFLAPVDDTWADDALNNPLGAYYRVKHDSVVDMQAAIAEVGALYCCSSVHKGWWLKSSQTLPVIKQHNYIEGAHAYCIVGYNQDGFIIQNSWGENWGKGGFAVLTYNDWVKNGSDAWVVARGVKTTKIQAPKMFSNHSLQDTSFNRSNPAQTNLSSTLKFPYPKNFPAKPWNEDTAYSHSLIITNNGRPKHTVISAEGPTESANIICYDKLREWLNESPRNRKIAIYVHGGLNSEESSINRVRVMAPYFKENGIYPLFVVWKTGLFETIENILQEAVQSILINGPAKTQRAEGIGEWISDKTDRAIETIARGLHAKGLWSEMKENAIYASDRAVPGFAQNRAGKEGAMAILTRSLKDLNNEFPNLQVHGVGHSAGAILIGSWLKELMSRNLKLSSCSLYAPACTIEFANKHYKPAIEKGALDADSFYIHNMDDEREKADSTALIYRKSLLYFVSRALEDVHKMPLLGLAAAWNEDNCHKQKSGGFHQSQKSEIKKWAAFMSDKKQPKLYKKKDGQVKINTNPDYIKLSHGSFDNDISVIEFTLKKILNKSKLKVDVLNLHGY